MSLFTTLYVDDVVASLAFHVTAPVELALTTFLYGSLVSVVASSAAHEIATVRRQGGPIANATRCSPGAGPLVSQAVIGRFVNVDEILSCWQVVARVPDLEFVSVVDLHLGGTVVFVLYIVSDFPERSQLLPARY